ncbi:hypothetical protein LINPERHAP1_LOCUS7082 [Linum perenne]
MVQVCDTESPSFTYHPTVLRSHFDAMSIKLELSIQIPHYGILRSIHHSGERRIIKFGCFDNYDTGNINGCSTKGTHRDKTIVGTELDSLQSLLTKLPEKQQVMLKNLRMRRMMIGMVQRVVKMRMKDKKNKLGGRYSNWKSLVFDGLGTK